MGPDRGFGFRLRFRLGRVRIDTQDTVLALTNPVRDAETVRLAAVQLDEPITAHQELQVSGKCYESAEAANAAGDRWQGIVEKAFARNKIGADFGRMAPQNFFARSFLDELEAEAGTQVIPDCLGLTVFDFGRGEPRFVKLDVESYPGRLPQHVLASVRSANQKGVRINSPRERLAYDLYSASFSMPYPDARFILLMMCLETLIDQLPRSQAGLDHVGRMLALTQEADLDDAERASLLSAMGPLKKQTVSRAGRQLVKHRLTGKSYRDERPARFFQACYDFRSSLVHGGENRPQRAEVEEYSVHLEVMLTDLLGLGLPEPG